MLRAIVLSIFFASLVSAAADPYTCIYQNSSTSFNLQCAAGSVISSIDFVYWGGNYQISGSCGSYYNYYSSYDSYCYGAQTYTPQVASQTQTQCLGQNSCNILTSSFYDPCPSTTKYFTVQYTCGTNHICAKSPTTYNYQQSLVCPSGQVITGVDYANFGTTSGACGEYYISSDDTVEVTALSYVKNNCLGQYTCSFMVNAYDSSSIFYYSSSSNSILTVQYSCGVSYNPPTNTAPTTIPSTGLLTAGNATKNITVSSSKFIQLTQQSYNAGAAWIPQAISLTNSARAYYGDLFRASFWIRNAYMTRSDGSSEYYAGDGLAFVVQTSGNTLVGGQGPSFGVPVGAIGGFRMSFYDSYTVSGFSNYDDKVILHDIRGKPFSYTTVSRTDHSWKHVIYTHKFSTNESSVTIQDCESNYTAITWTEQWVDVPANTKMYVGITAATSSYYDTFQVLDEVNVEWPATGNAPSFNQCRFAGEPTCTVANKYDYAYMTCPSGKVISSFQYVNYGVNTGTCGSFVAGCRNPSSYSYVGSQCLGQSSCQFYITDSYFGTDSCSTTDNKTLAVQYSCAATYTPAVTTGGITTGARPVMNTTGGVPGSPLPSGDLTGVFDVSGKTLSGRIYYADAECNSEFLQASFSFQSSQCYGANTGVSLQSCTSTSSDYGPYYRTACFSSVKQVTAALKASGREYVVYSDYRTQSYSQDRSCGDNNANNVYIYSTKTCLKDVNYNTGSGYSVYSCGTNGTTVQSYYSCSGSTSSPSGSPSSSQTFSTDGVCVSDNDYSSYASFRIGCSFASPISGGSVTASPIPEASGKTGYLLNGASAIGFSVALLLIALMF